MHNIVLIFLQPALKTRGQVPKLKGQGFLIVGQVIEPQRDHIFSFLDLPLNTSSQLCRIMKISERHTDGTKIRVD